jgi:integrase
VLCTTYVEQFLTHLVLGRHVAVATQNQVLAALLFLYREVMGVALPWLDGVVRAKKPSRLSQVLRVFELRAVLHCMVGREALVGGLLYGSGLRLLEALRLRVQDVNNARMQLTVRSGNGGKERMRLLSRRLIVALRKQMVDA